LAGDAAIAQGVYKITAQAAPAVVREFASAVALVAYEAAVAEGFNQIY